MTAQPTPANVLNLFKTNAQTTAAKSARVATLVQDGYRRWFDGVTASVNDASRLAAGLGKARNPADLAALQRDWLSTTQARVTESVQGFLDVSSKIAAEITALPAPAAEAAPVVAPVAAPAPKAEAPKPAPVAAPVVAAPKVEAAKVEIAAPAPAVEAPQAAPAPVAAVAAETAPVAATVAAPAAEQVEVPVKELVETVKAETAAPAAAIAAEAKAVAKPAQRRPGKPLAAKPASKTSPTVN
ncbi:phasin family protein [Azospirillum melinis]|uniref:phasin family protein n=1 Tax=Azospirillum melinis TaxID=328839 RepID=UPI0037578667